MDLTVGADAEVADRFSFRDAGAQVASFQRGASPINYCVAGCRKIARLVLLANHRSLRLLLNEWVILPTVPSREDRAVQPLLPVASEPVVSTAEGSGPVSDNSANSFTNRASTSSAGDKGRETVHAELREVASEP